MLVTVSDDQTQETTFVDLNHDQRYDPLQYHIYEETIANANSTENFIIERENFDDENHNTNNHCLEISLNNADSEPISQPSSNISIIEIKNLCSSQAIDIAQLQTANLFKNNFVMDLKADNCSNYAQNAIKTEMTPLTFSEESSNSISSSRDVSDHLQGTSTLLSPKSDSDVEQCETDLKSLNWLQNYTNIMAGKMICNFQGL